MIARCLGPGIDAGPGGVVEVLCVPALGAAVASSVHSWPDGEEEGEAEACAGSQPAGCFPPHPRCQRVRGAGLRFQRCCKVSHRGGAGGGIVLMQRTIGEPKLLKSQTSSRTSRPEGGGVHGTRLGDNLSCLLVEVVPAWCPATSHRAEGIQSDRPPPPCPDTHAATIVARPKRLRRSHSQPIPDRRCRVDRRTLLTLVSFESAPASKLGIRVTILRALSTVDHDPAAPCRVTPGRTRLG